jgi:hypothetical protein
MQIQRFSIIPKSKETTTTKEILIKVKNPQKLGLKRVKQHVYTTKLS